MQTGRSWARRAAGHAVGAAYLASVLAAAACTQEVILIRDLGDADLSAGEDLSTADLTPGPDMACSAQIQSCTGFCGPVTDACTGQTFQCGACPAGLVCDLYGTHTCITPKVQGK